MLLIVQSRSAILAGLVSLLLALVFMGTAFSPAGSDTVDITTVDLSEVREDAIKDLYDASGDLIDPHKQAAEVAKSHGGGFGGYYFDDSDPTVAYVYMKDTTKTEDAASAFRAIHRKDSQYTRIVPVRADYTLDELNRWYKAALPAFYEAGLLVTTSGVKIMRNQVKFGFDDASMFEDAWAVIDALNIPRGAVSLITGRGEFLADKDSVQAKWRPVVGGVKAKTPVECTIGFVTERNGIEGMVVASHCTNSSGRVGINDNFYVNQPVKNSSFNRVAREKVDPARSNLDLPKALHKFH